MSVLFDGSDEAYLVWLGANPGGRVVNLKRKPSSSYAVLHRVSCKMIRPNEARMTGGFTEHGYVKLCAADEMLALQALREVLRERAAHFSKACALCKP